ncbi:seven-hairpin glycosidase [Rhizoclosmatium globosum]|uniref:alpha-1,2-Mannosidase n=1 Tax=Rhizoclosmatium globosum TaxID=329046 RepID=A0A1Y2BKN9_9FUNG|nr:seven-hairpin glycosidase [Rhizoclosmatium globosum]|eukprot:ORY35190.1 seven-hairpin glycosidase [Rhizoclosmatium globosum]
MLFLAIVTKTGGRAEMLGNVFRRRESGDYRDICRREEVTTLDQFVRILDEEFGLILSDEEKDGALSVMLGLKPGDVVSQDLSVETINTLIHNHIRAIPFENLALCFLQKEGPITTETVFDQVVRRNEEDIVIRFVTEQHYHERRTAGTWVYSIDWFGANHKIQLCAERICSIPSSTYVKFVKIGDSTYMVDVGRHRLSQAILLRDGITIENAGGEEYQLREGVFEWGKNFTLFLKRAPWAPLAEGMESVADGFQPQLTFTLETYRPADFDMFNHYITTGKKHVMQSILLLSVVTKTGGRAEITEATFRRREGKDHRELDCKAVINSYEQLVRILDVEFGLRLTEEEKVPAATYINNMARKLDFIYATIITCFKTRSLDPKRSRMDTRARASAASSRSYQAFQATTSSDCDWIAVSASSLASQVQPPVTNDHFHNRRHSQAIPDSRNGQARVGWVHTLRLDARRPSSSFKTRFQLARTRPVAAQYANRLTRHSVLMGLMDEYNEAKELVLSHLDFDKVTEFVSLFETVIRVLGGLLAAYELDGDWRFIEKSVDLVERLLPALKFNWPLDHVNTTKWVSLKSELTLEFQYLSDITGNQTYANIALHIYDQLQKVPFVVPGLLPEYVDRETLTTSSPRVSIGGMGDSYYEYLLKLYLVTGETKYYDRYYASAEAILEHMAIKNKRGDTVVPAIFFGKDDTTGKIEKYQENKWEHLGCFAGGMFTSGVIFANPKPHNWKQHFELGSGLTETCWKMYNQTGTGIGPENVDAEELNSIDASYMLRPEAVEALFYMWRFTHDPIYRERAWVIVQNYEKHCRDDTGYHGLTNVNYENNNYLDNQESFFIAETLKYLYLIFSDDDTVPLDKYVFNTEAHVLSIRGHGRRSGVVRQ